MLPSASHETALSPEKPTIVPWRFNEIARLLSPAARRGSNSNPSSRVQRNPWAFQPSEASLTLPTITPLAISSTPSVEKGGVSITSGAAVGDDQWTSRSVVPNSA